MADTNDTITRVVPQDGWSPIICHKVPITQTITNIVGDAGSNEIYEGGSIKNFHAKIHVQDQYGGSRVPADIISESSDDYGETWTMNEVQEHYEGDFELDYEGHERDFEVRINKSEGGEGEITPVLTGEIEGDPVSVYEVAAPPEDAIAAYGTMWQTFENPYIIIRSGSESKATLAEVLPILNTLDDNKYYLMCVGELESSDLHYYGTEYSKGSPVEFVSSGSGSSLYIRYRWMMNGQEITDTDGSLEHAITITDYPTRLEVDAHYGDNFGGHEIGEPIFNSARVFMKSGAVKDVEVGGETPFHFPAEPDITVEQGGSYLYAYEIPFSPKDSSPNGFLSIEGADVKGKDVNSLIVTGDIIGISQVTEDSLYEGAPYTEDDIGKYFAVSFNAKIDTTKDFYWLSVDLSTGDVIDVLEKVTIPSEGITIETPSSTTTWADKDGYQTQTWSYTENGHTVTARVGARITALRDVAIEAELYIPDTWGNEDGKDYWYKTVGGSSNGVIFTRVSEDEDGGVVLKTNITSIPDNVTDEEGFYNIYFGSGDEDYCSIAKGSTLKTLGITEGIDDDEAFYFGAVEEFINDSGIEEGNVEFFWDSALTIPVTVGSASEPLIIFREGAIVSKSNLLVTMTRNDDSTYTTTDYQMPNNRALGKNKQSVTVQKGFLSTTLPVTVAYATKAEVGNASNGIIEGYDTSEYCSIYLVEVETPPEEADLGGYYNVDRGVGVDIGSNLSYLDREGEDMLEFKADSYYHYAYDVEDLSGANYVTDDGDIIASIAPKGGDGSDFIKSSFYEYGKYTKPTHYSVHYECYDGTEGFDEVVEIDGEWTKSFNAIKLLEMTDDSFVEYYVYETDLKASELNYWECPDDLLVDLYKEQDIYSDCLSICGNKEIDPTIHVDGEMLPSDTLYIPSDTPIEESHLEGYIIVGYLGQGYEYKKVEFNIKKCYKVGNFIYKTTFDGPSPEFCEIFAKNSSVGFVSEGLITLYWDSLPIEDLVFGEEFLPSYGSEVGTLTLGNKKYLYRVGLEPIDEPNYLFIKDFKDISFNYRLVNCYEPQWEAPKELIEAKYSFNANGTDYYAYPVEEPTSPTEYMDIADCFGTSYPLSSSAPLTMKGVLKSRTLGWIDTEEGYYLITTTPTIDKNTPIKYIDGSRVVLIEPELIEAKYSDSVTGLYAYPVETPTGLASSFDIIDGVRVQGYALLSSAPTTMKGVISSEVLSQVIEGADEGWYLITTTPTIIKNADIKYADGTDVVLKVGGVTSPYSIKLSEIYSIDEGDGSEYGWMVDIKDKALEGAMADEMYYLAVNTGKGTVGLYVLNDEKFPDTAQLIMSWIEDFGEEAYFIYGYENPADAYIIKDDGTHVPVMDYMGGGEELEFEPIDVDLDYNSPLIAISYNSSSDMSFAIAKTEYKGTGIYSFPSFHLSVRPTGEDESKGYVMGCSDCPDYQALQACPYSKSAKFNYLIRSMPEGYDGTCTVGKPVTLYDHVTEEEIATSTPIYEV